MSSVSRQAPAEPQGVPGARLAIGTRTEARPGFERGRVTLQLRSRGAASPAVGARVLVGDAGVRETLGVVQELLFGSGELPDAWRASALVFEAGAQGRVDVPIPRGLALIAVEAGLERGFHLIASPRVGIDRWRTADTMVWLERPGDLELEFVDQRGEPRAGIAFGAGPWATYQSRIWVAGSADSLGHARLHHFRTLFPAVSSKRTPGLFYSSRPGDWLPIPLDPSTQPLDAWGAPHPLTIVVPRGADLLVRAMDGRGRPLRDPWFELHGEVEHEGESAHVLRDLNGAGQVWLRDLPANERFWVASRERRFGEPWQFEGAVTGVTPGVGESLSIVLTCSDAPAPSCVVRGRLVAPEGVRPLGSSFTASVHVDEVGGVPDGESQGPRHQDLYRRGQADEDGEFMLTLPGLAAELAGGGSLCLGLEVSRWGACGERLQGGAPARARPVEAGQVDLGELPLERVGVLCEGWVVDQAGQPVDGAGVRVGSATGGEAGSRASVRELLVAERGVSDARGHFELRGVLPQGTLALRVECPGYRTTDWLTVIDPGEPVYLELEQVGSIEGSLLLEAGQTSRAFEVGLESEGSQRGGPRPGHVEWTWLEGGQGTFGWSELDPGWYTVRIRLGATREELISIEGVEVLAGEVTRDERLAGIRLRGVARTVELSILGEGDEPLSYASIEVWHDGVELGTAWYGRGHERLVLASVPVTLWVTAEGYAPTRFDVFESPAVLRMRPGIAARAQLTGPLVLPPCGSIEWSLSPLDEVPGLMADTAMSSVTFASADRPVDFRLAVPGRWEASLMLLVTKGDSAAWAVLGSHPDPWVFDVPAGGGVAGFVVPVTQAEVDAAWAEIQADD